MVIHTNVSVAAIHRCCTTIVAMKTPIIALLLLVTSCAFADVAVYNGVKVLKTTSPAGSATTVQKFIQVLDLETSEMVVISLGGKGRKKTFVVEPATTVLMSVVRDGRSKRTLTVLSQADTLIDELTGDISVTSFLQVGGNLSVSLKTGAKTDLPRNLQGNASWVIDSEGGDEASYSTAKYTLVLQDKLSRPINDAGDTLQLAVERLAADLVAKGYLDETPEPEPDLVTQ